MAVTEKQRELFNEIERTLGAEHAATMMELLPPVGWADVATKRDLDALEDRLRMATRDDLNGAINGLRRDVITWILTAMGIQTAVVGLLFTLATR